MLRHLLTTLVLCPFALCQQQAPQGPSRAEASPRDLAISCYADPSTRMVRVTLVNQSLKPVYVQYENNVDSRNNYEVIASDPRGKPFPKPATPVPVPLGPGIREVFESSFGHVDLDPRQFRTEEFPLSTFAQLPKEGKVRIKIGRRLSVRRPGQPEATGASRILWCEPINVLLTIAK